MAFVMFLAVKFRKGEYCFVEEIIIIINHYTEGDRGYEVATNIHDYAPYTLSNIPTLTSS